MDLPDKSVHRRQDSQDKKKVQTQCLGHTALYLKLWVIIFLLYVLSHSLTRLKGRP